jgi:hypothetical protein
MNADNIGEIIKGIKQRIKFLILYSMQFIDLMYNHFERNPHWQQSNFDIKICD